MPELFVAYDLPFLKEMAKRDILGGNAVRLFNLDLGEKLAKWRNAEGAALKPWRRRSTPQQARSPAKRP
jgi:hypothetical protein